MICGIIALSVFKQEAPNIPKKVFPLFFMYLERLFFICFRLVLLLMNFFSKISSRTMLCVTVLDKKKGPKRGFKTWTFFYFSSNVGFCRFEAMHILKNVYHISNFSNTMSNSHEMCLFI